MQESQSEKALSQSPKKWGYLERGCTKSSEKCETSQRVRVIVDIFLCFVVVFLFLLSLFVGGVIGLFAIYYFYRFFY
jgi:hypothetical protein